MALMQAMIKILELMIFYLLSGFERVDRANVKLKWIWILPAVKKFVRRSVPQVRFLILGKITP